MTTTFSPAAATPALSTLFMALPAGFLFLLVHLGKACRG